ncbi:MAG: hypothetical protein LBB45_06835 [Methanobrevibacter sp.]|jgi:hypothetical protein|nr:hypothetical protein [Candidatus Methanovirga basalitermitum]
MLKVSNFPGGGGAIKNLGKLNINKSTFKSNTATNSYSVRGGAVVNSNDTEITNIHFMNNSALGSGGAVKIWYSCKYLIKDSTFENNTVNEFGGAVDFDNLIKRDWYSSDPGITQGNNYNASLINIQFLNNHAKWVVLLKFMEELSMP